jgi:hypothetical protein
MSIIRASRGLGEYKVTGVVFGYMTHLPGYCHILVAVFDLRDIDDFAHLRKAQFCDDDWRVGIEATNAFVLHKPHRQRHRTTCSHCESAVS